jgi:hypothetical protein
MEMLKRICQKANFRYIFNLHFGRILKLMKPVAGKYHRQILTFNVNF